MRDVVTTSGTRDLELYLSQADSLPDSNAEPIGLQMEYPGMKSGQTGTINSPIAVTWG